MKAIFKQTVLMVAMITVSTAVALAATPAYSRSLAMIQREAKQPVSHQELVRFVSVIKEIQPIDIKAHELAKNSKLNDQEKRYKLAQYEGQIKGVVLHNHLTPVRYASLIRKTQIDPRFAARVKKYIS
ncbi:DUF4168 domain-containing protein [Acidithiobacillus sp.]|uniref:DUF4168 domain-containing protein n=1 Tax=Acidithiobacillus sp. TaxID=1872118 RepID=UPI0032AEA470